MPVKRERFRGGRATLTAGGMEGLAGGLLLGGSADVVEVGKPFFDMTQPDGDAEVGIIGHRSNPEAGYSFSVELTGGDGATAGGRRGCAPARSSPGRGFQLLGDTEDV